MRHILLAAVLLACAYARAETVAELQDNGIPASTSAATPAKGKLWVGASTTNWSALGAGTNGYVLTFDSTQPLGIKWAEATGGGGAGTVTNVATGSGLTGGPITNTGTISIATGGILNTHVNAAAAIDWTKISKVASSLADLETRSATDLTSGTLADARFPATLPALSGVNLTALNATQLTSGTVNIARLPFSTALYYLRTNAAGTAAEYAAFPAYEVPLTFGTGLTRAVDTITVNTTQNITKLSNLTGNGFVKTSGGDGTLSVDTNTYLTTAVTSVALTAPTSVFDIAGSPVTTTGTLALSFDNQSANTVFAGPTNGAATTPAFRALVAADIPSLTATYEVPLTFSTGLTRTVNTITVNTSQNIATLSNLTSNGFVKTGSGNGTLSIDTNTYLTGTTGAPIGAKYIVQQADADLTNEQATGALATGIVKNTTTTGVLSIAVAGTDYQTPLTAGTNYEVPLTFSTGLTRNTNTITVNTSQNIATLSNLTTNGYIRTSGAAGTLNVDTPTQTTAALNAVVGDSGAGGTKGLVPAPAAGDTAANKFLKADGTWTVVPSSGAPTDATYITQTAHASLSNEQALGALATGIVKNTTTTGVLSIAASGTDYELPLTFSAGLTRTVNTVTVNTSQNIAKLSNLTSNGFVRTTGGDGTLSILTNPLTIANGGTGISNTNNGDLIYGNGANNFIVLPVGAANTFLTSSGTAPQWSSFPDSYGRNLLINGSFRFWQRGSSGFATDNTYGPDRWRVLVETATATQLNRGASSVTTSKYDATLVVGAANNNKFGIFQIIEGVNCYRARGKSVTLSANIKSTSGISNVRMGILQWTSTEDNGGTAFPDPINVWGAASTNPTLTTWTYVNTPTTIATTSTPTVYSVSGTMSTSTTNIGVFIWCDDETTTSTTDSFSVTDIQLEVNSYATTFEQIPISDELLRAQRYYEKSYDMETPPGNTSASSYYVFYTESAVNLQRYGAVPFRVSKRSASATASIWSYAGTANKMGDVNGTDSTNANTGTVFDVSEHQIVIYNNSGSTYTPTGKLVIFQWAAESEL